MTRDTGPRGVNNNIYCDFLRVRGCGRYPTAGRNQPSAYEYGHLLSDALGAWVSQGLMAGPFSREELPWDEVGNIKYYDEIIIIEIYSINRSRSVLWASS